MIWFTLVRGALGELLRHMFSSSEGDMGKSSDYIYASYKNRVRKSFRPRPHQKSCTIVVDVFSSVANHFM